MVENLDEKTTLEQLKKEIAKFTEERNWSKYHKPKDLAVSISIEAGELLENFQWLTDDEIERLIKDPKKMKLHFLKREDIDGLERGILPN